jgi:hypothetical protein
MYTYLLNNAVRSSGYRYISFRYTFRTAVATEFPTQWKLVPFSPAVNGRSCNPTAKCGAVYSSPNTSLRNGSQSFKYMNKLTLHFEKLIVNEYGRGGNYLCIILTLFRHSCCGVEKARTEKSGSPGWYCGGMTFTRARCSLIRMDFKFNYFVNLR